MRVSTAIAALGGVPGEVEAGLPGRVPAALDHKRAHDEAEPNHRDTGAQLAGADIMVIACDRLIRIDFSAAGTLLNWVTARVAEGRQVQFVEVHRLVAAFFNVIGISEHARVGMRNE